MEAPSAPAMAGLHHLTLLVGDLDVSLEWCERALGAKRVARLDHVDEQGTRTSVVLEVDGLGTFLQLRRSVEPVAVVAGFQPITFGAKDEAALHAWMDHLDAVGVAHSPINQRFAGRSVTFSTPDGTELAVYAAAG